MSATVSVDAPGHFAAREIRIPPERVLRVMGYRDDAAIRAPIRRTAEAMATMLTSVAAPRASYRRVPIARCGLDGLTLSTGTTFRGPTFSAYLADCAEVAIFILSLGSRFDSTQKHLTESGHSVEAYMLEIAGWLGIEEATRLFRAHLDEEARSNGLQLTRRMAPGYTSRVGGQKVEWPLEDQLPLFSLFFDDSNIPARLLEGSCAMTPKMSRSGLYGLHRSQQ